jgi:hypothetical protein
VTVVGVTLVDPSAPKHRVRPGRPRRRRLLVAASGLALVAVGGFVLWSSKPAPRPASAPASSSPQATPSAANSQGLNPQGLAWAPPPLSHPKTIEISASNRELRLDDKTDYRLVLPSTPVTLTGGLTVTGGHNVVLIGGTIQVPPVKDAAQPQKRRGVFLKDQTGVIHIEGLRLSGPLSEGFDLDERQGGIVQIENVQVDMVYGTRATNHADVIQTWAGPAQLRVDGLRASSEYQGLFLLPNQHWETGPQPTSFDFRRSIITMGESSGYGLWTPSSPAWLHADGLTIVDANTDRGRVLWPASSHPAVRVATPGSTDAHVDFPAGNPGNGYRTPGYASPTA